MHKEIIIPFMGFYESIHESAIDSAFEQIFDYDGDGEIDLPQDKIDDFWSEYNPIDWGIYKEYCSEYVNFIADEYEIKLTYETMVSPREYNFTTDRIFAKIDDSEIESLFEKTDKEILKKLIVDKFTSYDGFSSFYSNNIDAWLAKPLLDWDHNELGTLLEAFILTKTGAENIFEVTDYLFDVSAFEIVDNNIPNEFYSKYTNLNKGGHSRLTQRV